MSSDKSTGQIVGGIIGAVVGYFAGNVYLGYAIGTALGGYIDPPPGQEFEGPRLQDLAAQTASYGTPIPRLYSTMITHGNIFWLENDSLREVVRKEKQGGKGGGGQATLKTYSYYATFAVSLCEGPVIAIKRLWISDKLVYNAGSNDMATVIASNKQAGGWALHTGEDDQSPNARMQADKGAANTPRYPGLAYIVFYDLALADYGDSLQGAQIKAEVVTSAATSLSLSKSSVVKPDASFSGSELAGSCNYFMDGVATFIYPGWDNSYLNANVVTVYDYPSSQLAGASQIVGTGRLVKHGYADEEMTYCVRLLAANRIYIANFGYAYLASTNCSSFDESLGSWCLVNSRAFILDIFNGYVAELDAQGPSETSSGLAKNTPITGAKSICANDDASEIYVLTSSGVTVLDADNFATLDTFALTLTSFDSTAGKHRILYDRGLLYLIWQDGVARDLMIVDAATGSVIDTIASTPFAMEFSRCLQINNGVAVYSTDIGATYDAQYYNLSLLTDSPEPLSAIVSAEMRRSELITASDIDVTDLTDDVRGFRVPGIMSPRAAIAPLQGAYPFDLVPSGYKIKAVRRGNSSMATIYAEDLGARRNGETFEVALSRQKEMDSQLPRKVIVRHLDPNRGGDINEQYSAERQRTSAFNIRQLELPLSLSADEAAQIAEVLHNAQWLGRWKFDFTLPPTWLALEPADVVTVVTDDGSYELLLTSIDYELSGRVLVKGATLNSPVAWISSAIGGEGNVTDGVVTLVGTPVTLLLDLPMIRDTDDGAGFGAAMTSPLPNWPGGALFRSRDNGSTWASIQGFAGGVPIGYGRTALSANDGYVVDYSNSLTVDLLSGSLSSITEAQMLTGLNWCAYGVDGRWELLRFTTATLNADGSYTLTGLLRGCRGTEWTTGLHTDGDWFVFLDDSDVAVVGADINNLGVGVLFKGASVGQDVSTVASQSFTYNGANLKPLPPVLPYVEMDGDAYLINATRRSRFTSSVWTTGIDYILGEASESYEIDILDTGVVVRTLSGTSFPITYSEADQITDFGSTQTSIDIKIYQMSATVGRGFPLTVTLDSNAPRDNYFSYVVALLHFNGADADTSFTDVQANSWTANTNAQLDDAQKKFGATSGLFDGAGDDCFETADSADWDFGTNDFTVEAWVRFNGVSTVQGIVSNYENSSLGWSLDFDGTTNNLKIFHGGTLLMQRSWAPSTGVWYHVAAARSGTNLRFFVNGTQLGATGTDSTSLSGSSATLKVGALQTAGTPYQPFNGWIDEVRITKGIARYTANFSAPTLPFPDQ